MLNKIELQNESIVYVVYSDCIIQQRGMCWSLLLFQRLINSCTKPDFTRLVPFLIRTCSGFDKGFVNKCII